MKRLTTLSLAKDYDGINELVSQGKVILISAGTRAIVIDPGILATEVRIKSGPYSGRSGFVPAEHAR
jgi:hypothetical protein